MAFHLKVASLDVKGLNSVIIQKNTGRSLKKNNKGTAQSEVKSKTSSSCIILFQGTSFQKL